MLSALTRCLSVCVHRQGVQVDHGRLRLDGLGRTGLSEPPKFHSSALAGARLTQPSDNIAFIGRSLVDAGVNDLLQQQVLDPMPSDWASFLTKVVLQLNFSELFGESVNPDEFKNLLCAILERTQEFNHVRDLVNCSPDSWQGIRIKAVTDHLAAWDKCRAIIHYMAGIAVKYFTNIPLEGESRCVSEGVMLLSLLYPLVDDTFDHVNLDVAYKANLKKGIVAILKGGDAAEFVRVEYKMKSNEFKKLKERVNLIYELLHRYYQHYKNYPSIMELTLKLLELTNSSDSSLAFVENNGLSFLVKLKSLDEAGLQRIHQLTIDKSATNMRLLYEIIRADVAIKNQVGGFEISNQGVEIIERLGTLGQVLNDVLGVDEDLKEGNATWASYAWVRGSFSGFLQKLCDHVDALESHAISLSKVDKTLNHASVMLGVYVLKHMIIAYGVAIDPKLKTYRKQSVVHASMVSQLLQHYRVSPAFAKQFSEEFHQVSRSFLVHVMALRSKELNYGKSKLSLNDYLYALLEVSITKIMIRVWLSRAAKSIKHALDLCARHVGQYGFCYALVLVLHLSKQVDNAGR